MSDKQNVGGDKHQLEQSQSLLEDWIQSFRDKRRTLDERGQDGSGT